MKTSLLGQSFLFTAFVLLGSFLLLTLWFTGEFENSVLRDFREKRVSVSFSEPESFKNWIREVNGIESYRMYSPQVNREKLFSENPRYQDVLASLDIGYFPWTALVTVKDIPEFTKAFEASDLDGSVYSVHQPPLQLQWFLRIVFGSFVVLWLLSLGMIIYFSLDRAAQRLMPRWVLMRMLGARIHQVYAPLITSQLTWIASGIFLSVLLSQFATELIVPLVGSGIGRLSIGYLILVSLSSLLFAVMLSFVLFYSRYRRVYLG